MFSKMKKKMMPGKKFYSKYLLCIQTRKSKKMFQKCFEKKIISREETEVQPKAKKKMSREEAEVQPMQARPGQDARQ